jgi:hypothetical protein
MKNLSYLFIVTLLFLFGCDQATEIASSERQIFNKQLITLPQKKGLVVEEIHTESKYINGSNGGWFSEEFSYQGGPSGNVNITSTLHFFSNSFSGGKTITQSFNTDNAAITFGPSMQFNVPVDYTLTINGADLTGINPSTLDFVYIDSNGNMFECDYEYVTMDLSTGLLKVKNAKLNHFSRYGFVN